jgi:hypothetical protein
MADKAAAAAAAEQPQTPDADDLNPTQTAGYKAPAQKTLEEMRQLDQNDESLQKWKESLLKNASAGISFCKDVNLSL